MKTPMNLNQKSNLTEAHYVALRVLVAMLRDPKVGEAAHRNPEVSRAVVWLCTQFGGIAALGEASGLIGKEQRDLRLMYEAGCAANDIRAAIKHVLTNAWCVSLNDDGHALRAERLYAAMAYHFRDMVRSNFKQPEDPLPDACLAISSEE